MARSLSELEEALAPIGWAEEALELVRALITELDAGRPACLAEVSGTWREPYLELRLLHTDGTVLEVVQGDGYTELSDGAFQLSGHVDGERLALVLRAALRGDLEVVRHYRLGMEVALDLRVEGRAIARHAPWPRALLRVVPVSSRSTVVRVRFDAAPAATR